MSKLRARDLFTEAAAATFRRKSRTLLTALGTFIGIALFIATIGLTGTVAAQIGTEFDLLEATQVVIVGDSRTMDHSDDLLFPLDSDDRLNRLVGVEAGGVSWSIDPTPTIETPLGTERPAGAFPIVVNAATPGRLEASDPEVLGRLFDAGHSERRSRVAVVGAAAARQLRLSPIQTQPYILIDGKPFAVIGIADNFERSPQLSVAILIPASTAAELWGPPNGTQEVQIVTRPGAANVVASQAPLALRPSGTRGLQVIVPPSSDLLRQRVDAGTRGLYLALAGLASMVGIFGIANATLVAVIERRSEIGIRRALGAKRRHIVGQILAEAGLVGLFAAVLGAFVGVGILLVVAIVNQWTPVMPAWPIAIAPLAGVLAGAVAGLYPAFKAARMPPFEALRS